MGTGRFTVVTVAGEPGTMEASAEVAVAKGREAGAALAVVVHLTRLAGTGRLRLIAYDVGSGNFSHADSIAIAGGPDDLDPALKRLAVGLATGKPASQTADIESVTQKQADPLLKESATKIFGLRLGAIVAFNRPADLETAALPGLGIFWMYDARSFLGEVALDFHTARHGTRLLGQHRRLLPVQPGQPGALPGHLGVVFDCRPGRGGRQRHPAGAGVRRAVRAAVDGAVPGRDRVLLQHLRRAGQPGDGEAGAPVPASGDKHFAHGPQFSVGLGF